MNIIIIGCGKVGTTLAAELNEEGNNITVVDMDGAIVERVAAQNDIMGVIGNGATHSVQAEAGIGEADLLIAVTGSDELNLLCCTVAKMNGTCQTIARVRNPDYSADAPYLKRELGLAMVINPEQATAAEIARVLRFPSASKVETFAGGRVELIKFRLPEGSPLVGMAVKDVAGKLKCDVLFCTVEREDEAYIANGDFVFAERDVVSIIAPAKSVGRFFEKIRYKSHAAKNAILLGGGDISRYLCEILIGLGVSVRLIEHDAARCEALADEFPKAEIIRGGSSDKELLLEEDLCTADAFVALTKYDEENIFISLFAKQVGRGKVVTKINRTDFDEVTRHLDLDTVIYPENITADIILRHVRAMKNTIGSNVENLYHIINGKVEAAEFYVKESCPLIGIPLAELSLKKGVLIAAILRGKRVIIPRGRDTIEAGDAVVIVSSVLAMHDITDVLA